MEVWGIICQVITILAIPSTIGLLWKYLFDRKVKRSEEYKKLKKKEFQDNVREVIREEVKSEVEPLNDKIDKVVKQNEKMTNKLELVGDGTLCSLRDDILSSYYKCSEKKYRNDYDYQNIHDLYEAYKNLDGNSFVADVISRFDALPTKEEYTATKKKAGQK